MKNSTSLKYLLLLSFIGLAIGCSDQGDSKKTSNSDSSDSLSNSIDARANPIVVNSPDVIVNTQTLYDVWLEAGNVGTIEDFLNYLKDGNSQDSLPDFDGDGVADVNELCPASTLDPVVYYADKDGDGLGDPSVYKLLCDGDEKTGYVDNSLDVIGERIYVKEIYSNVYTFAALKNDGSVLTWGESSYGDSSGKDLLM